LTKKQDKLDLDDSWIDALFQWADNNNIPELQFIEDDTLCDDGERPIEGFWVGLPRDREVLVSLEELDLSWHSCSEIPKQIKYLKKLKKFRFSKSRDGRQPPFMKNADGLDAIEEIPDWITELENLEELDLSHNKICYVPNVIGKLNNLKKLYLHRNMIMFVDAELASLCKLEVLWIWWNEFSVLDGCIDNLKELVNFDVDWKQPNKLSLLIDCIHRNDFPEYTGEKCFDLFIEDLNAVVNGVVLIKGLTGSNDHEILWNEWSRLNNLKYKLKNLKNLRELYCSGLDYPDGPIKLCPEGLIVTSDMEPKAEDCVEILLENTPVFLVKSDAFEVIIELNEHHGKSLMEKIDFMELWR
jgi:Leucine-rich repeat (LRR) protein